MPTRIHRLQAPDDLTWRKCPSQPTVETAIRGARGYVRLVARPEWLVVFGPNEASIFAHNVVNGSFKLD